MPRSINESITALENARNDIVDALNSKIEGGGIEKTLKISEVAEKINIIETGSGSSNNNEIDLSDDKEGFARKNLCMLIFPFWAVDYDQINFSVFSGSKPIYSYIFEKKYDYYIYIGIFQVSLEKVEIKLEEPTGEGDPIEFFSGLIDLSKPKLYLVKEFNRSSNEEPKL